MKKWYMEYCISTDSFVAIKLDPTKLGPGHAQFLKLLSDEAGERLSKIEGGIPCTVGRTELHDVDDKFILEYKP